MRRTARSARIHIPAHVAAACANAACVRCRCRCGTNVGLATGAVAASYQLPAGCEANSQQEGRRPGSRAARRSNASIVLAEDLRQALQRAVPSKPQP